MSNQIAIQEIKTQINAIKAQILLLTNKMDNFELDPDDFADQYDEMLDEAHGDFLGYSASQILKEVDPTAYRCGLLDYVDRFDRLDQDEEKMRDSDYAEWTEEKEDLESELEELEDQLYDLEMEDEKETNK